MGDPDFINARWEKSDTEGRALYGSMYMKSDG